MVTSFVPGASGAAGLGVDGRYARPAEAPKREDTPGRVEFSAASIQAAGDSVRDALKQVHSALALGHDAQALLVKVQALAGEGAGAQAQLEALLSAYARRVEAALADGVLSAGESITVQAEPNSAPVAIAGFDLRLGGVISVDPSSCASNAELAQAARRSIETLQEAMARLLDSARALEAHRGFLDAATGAAGVRHDLDTDGARLLALQVRQGAGAPIANAEPQAVLALFR